jgi:hypothetical protein
MRRDAFLVGAILLIGASGCRDTPSGVPSKVVCILVDRSGSTSDQRVRQKYSDSLRRVLEGVSAGDIIVADAISDNPLGQSSFPVNEEFERFDPGTDNPLLVRRKREEHDQLLKVRREQIWARAEGLLAGAASRQTRILDAMLLADRVFHTYKRQKKVLVVFSDMIEESDRYNFTRDKLDEPTVRRIIDHERQAERLPDLAGVRVYVVGAGSTSQLMPSEQFIAIERFWLAYLKAAGADAVRERYGAALLRFDE